LALTGRSVTTGTPISAEAPAEFTDWVMNLLAGDSASSHLLGQSLIRFDGNRAAVET